MWIIGVSIILHIVLYNYDKARIVHVMVRILTSKFMSGELSDKEYEEKKQKAVSGLNRFQLWMYKVLYKS